jgi:preprotein translocase subunit SecG
MEKLQLFLLILQVVIALVMIVTILLQKSGGDSLGGIGGSGSGGLGGGISARASANAITKFTIFLVALFMLNSLILARISAKPQQSTGLKIDQIIQQENNGNSNQNNKPLLPPIE